MNANTKEIFKSSVATLSFDAQYNLAYLVWDGALTLDKYKEPFLFLLNDFKPEINGILSDIRKQSVVGPEMRNWLQKEATPRGYLRGLRYYYAVSDSNVFKQYYVNTLLKLLSGDGIGRKLFHDWDKADAAIKTAIYDYKNMAVSA